MKVCTRCKEEKSLDCYSIHQRSKGNLLRAQCKDCHAIARKETYQRHAEKRRAYSKEYHQANLEENRRKAREGQLKRKYGITLEQYNKMLEDQNGVCLICSGTGGMSHMLTPLVVDHDHTCCEGQTTCGKCVRGLLCSGCNTGIGLLKDDPNILLAAAAYLMQTEDILLKVGNL